MMLPVGLLVVVLLLPALFMLATWVLLFVTLCRVNSYISSRKQVFPPIAYPPHAPGFPVQLVQSDADRVEFERFLAENKS